MDLGGIGSYQVPDPRINGGFSGISGFQSAGAASGESFSELMEKTLRRQRDEIPPVPSGKKPVIDKASKLYETCLDLEGFLIKSLLTSMRNTIQKSGLMDDGGFAGKLYEDMLYDEYARDFTRHAGFGLADLAYLELTNQRGTMVER
jgi:flagellar protein FlgJ